MTGVLSLAAGDEEDGTIAGGAVAVKLGDTRGGADDEGEARGDAGDGGVGDSGAVGVCEVAVGGAGIGGLDDAARGASGATGALAAGRGIDTAPKDVVADGVEATLGDAGVANLGDRVGAEAATTWVAAGGTAVVGDGVDVDAGAGDTAKDDVTGDFEDEVGLLAGVDEGAGGEDTCWEATAAFGPEGSAAIAPTPAHSSMMHFCNYLE